MMRTVLQHYRRIFLCLLVGTACILQFSARLCLARVWRVSPTGQGDALTIQSAIDSAGSGDEVRIDLGTYYESLDFLGKNIRVCGSGKFQTTIDASPLDAPCVRFRSGESNSAVLEALTITGGRGERYGNARMGGGIIIDGAEPTLRNLRVVNNTAIGETGSYGGGIQIFGMNWNNPAHPLIESCEFENNTAGSNGGGISFSGLVVPTIRNCTISHNRALGADGGGIRGVTVMGPVVIERNTILENTAGDHGGGLYLVGGPGTPLVEAQIVGNLFARNSASGGDSQDLTGGGMYLAYLDAQIKNNTIVYNSAGGGSGIVAGGVGLRAAGEYLIELNIIAYTENGYGIICDNGTIPEISNNLAWHNWLNGRFACQDWADSNGNVIADPLFCDPEFNNFSVQENSPALTRFYSPAGFMGAPGCRGKIIFTTWSAIKSLFR